MTANLFSKPPMWEDRNTNRYPEPIKKHVVCYMQNVRLPSTRDDVVKETKKKSQAVVKE